MDESSILSQLTQYVANEILEGEEVGLQPDTDLLKLGVINSMELMRLQSFIEDQYGVEIPMEQVFADNFKDLSTITQLVTSTLQQTDG